MSTINSSLVENTTGTLTINTGANSGSAAAVSPKVILNGATTNQFAGNRMATNKLSASTSTTPGTAPPVSYVITKANLKGSGLQVVEKSSSLAKETSSSMATSNFIQASGTSTISSANGALGKILMHHTNNVPLNEHSINQIILGAKQSNSSNQGFTATLAKTTIAKQPQLKTAEGLQVPQASPSTFLQQQPQHQPQQVQAIVSNPMSQTQLHHQQQPTIISILPSPNVPLPNFSNCTVITPLPVSVPASLNVSVAPTIFVAEMPVTTELQQTFPLNVSQVNLPPGIELLRANPNTIKPTLKPEDIIPQTTISSTLNKPAAFNANPKSLLNNVNRSLPLPKSSVITKNGPLEAVTGNNSLINASPAYSQVKVVNKTETIAAAFPSDHSNSSNGVILNKNANNKNPIILSVTTPLPPKRNSLENPANNFSSNIGAAQLPKSSSQAIQTPNYQNAVIKTQKRNPNPASLLLASRLIQNGSPRKRAQSLQTETLDQQSDQPPRDQENQELQAEYQEQINGFTSSGVSIERRHSSAPEAGLRSSPSLSRASSNSSSLVNCENVSRTVDFSSDSSSSKPQSELSKTQQENEENIFGIEMIEEYLPSSSEKSVNGSQGPIENDIEEVQDEEQEPESILPDQESLPIQILPAQSSDSMEVENIEASDNQEQQHDEETRMSSSEKLQASQEEISHQVEENQMKSMETDPNDSMDDDLIIIEPTTDNVEIPDDEEDSNKANSRNMESSCLPINKAVTPSVLNAATSQNQQRNFNVIKSSLTPTNTGPSVSTKPTKYPVQATRPLHPIGINANLSNTEGDFNSPLSDPNSLGTMLKMISNFNMLSWKERIGRAKGTNIVFELNEYNLLQIYERCPTRTNIHTAYEKPIYDRTTSVRKDESQPYDNSLYFCKRCNCHGSASDFLAPNFCSLQCLNRDNRKRKRPLPSAPNVTNAPNSNNSLKTIEQAQILGNSTQSVKRRFVWDRYLTNKSDALAAPIHFFLNPYPIGRNPFTVGMKLEAIDPENCSLFCICTIVQIKGYRLRLHFDGYDSLYDFWVNADSMDIFPLGWCAKTGRVLQPPLHHDSKTFNLKKYVEYSGALVASRNLFTHLNSTCSDVVNPFKIGMHLEAEDLNDTGKLCVATVADVINDRIRIHFDGWDDCYDYWVHISSPYIHPCGWHVGRQQLIVPPDYENVSFIWNDYIESIGKGSPATVDLFCVRDPIDFQPEMRLEVVDPKNPALIRPASIVQRKGHRIKIHLECWPAEYCFWLEDDSPDLHPINWCDETYHDLEPPPGYPQKATRLPCVIAGCRGLGNAKILAQTVHSRIDQCPYAPGNWRTKLEKPQRVRSEDIVRPPDETAPFIEMKKENLSLMSKVILKENTPALVNSITKKVEEILLGPDMPVPLLVKNEIKENIPFSSSSMNKESKDLVSSHLLVRNNLANVTSSGNESDEEKISNSQKLSSSQSSNGSSSSGGQDMPLEMKIAQEYLCDYGPRLKQNFDLLKNHLGYKVENVKENPILWNCKRTADYVESILESKKIARNFLKAEIDGVAFLMLQQNDLTDLLEIKLGPAVKLYSSILQLRVLYLKNYEHKTLSDTSISSTNH